MTGEEMIEMLEKAVDKPIQFVRGGGYRRQGMFCVLAAAHAVACLLKGLPACGNTDEDPGFCPVIRSLAAFVNDRLPCPSRGTWARKIISRLVDSNLGHAVSCRRAEHCARTAVSRFAATVLASVGLGTMAEELRSLSAAPLSEVAAAMELRAAAVNAFRQREVPDALAAALQSVQAAGELQAGAVNETFALNAACVANAACAVADYANAVQPTHMASRMVNDLLDECLVISSLCIPAGRTAHKRMKK